MNEEIIMSKEVFEELVNGLEFIESLTLYGRKSLKCHIKRLQEENQQLKGSLETHEILLKANFEENQKLKKQLDELQTSYNNMFKCHCNRVQVETLLEQQKEFIDYLEKEIVDSRAGSSQYYSAIQHLKLFKEIIGSDK